jgi:predicted acyltransferase
LYIRIVRRTGSLIALGLVLNIVAALPSLTALRIPGVLQRIGLVYLIAAPIVLHVRPTWRSAILVALVIGHWALLTLVRFDDGSAGLAQSHNLARFVDMAVFGRHVLNATGDPEGLLGTVPAVSSALMGSIAGEWLRRQLSVQALVGRLTIAGFGALCVGLIWASTLPLNKSLWTGSFVMWTGGIAALILAGCYLLLDGYHHQSWAQPFLWLGFNPLAIYFLSELVSDMFDKPWLRVAGQTLTVRSWLFWDVLRPATSGIGDEWISLAVALLTVTFWIAVAGLLYGRGVRLSA